MKIHIVIRNAGEDRIIPNLYGHLAGQLNCTMGAAPNPQADINLFSTYIEMGELYPTFNETFTAAYFSHYETDNKRKSLWWDIAAKQVNLRLYTAPRYLKAKGIGLEQYGTCAQIIPFVDRTLFRTRPNAPQMMQAPRSSLEAQRATQLFASGRTRLIGVSGFVPRTSKRKGEDLVRRLSQDATPELQNIEVIASGAGWPVTQRQYDRKERPNFYGGLDIFLCTSSIEGIPATVLEALACGVPVVIPRDVGLLDALPDIPGIARYTARNYASMRTALLNVLAARDIDNTALSNSVGEYTPQAWVQSHLTALENATRNTEPLPKRRKPRKNWAAKSGIYVVAFGDNARSCAVTMLKSAAKHMPKVGLAYVSDAPIPGVPKKAEFIEQPDFDVGGRAAKLKVDDLAPAEWENVLYMDADTEIIDDISPMFKMLDSGFEFVICKNPVRYSSTLHMHRPDYVEEVEETLQLLGHNDLMQFNGGVFGFRRCDRTEQFFAKWYSEWMRYRGRDQAALLRALWAVPLRFVILGNEFNNVTRYGEISSATIRHYPLTARRWDGLIPDGLDSQQAWDAVADWERRNK